jgi:hypothetical protein
MCENVFARECVREYVCRMTVKENVCVCVSE